MLIILQNNNHVSYLKFHVIIAENQEPVCLLKKLYKKNYKMHLLPKN